MTVQPAQPHSHVKPLPFIDVAADWFNQNAANMSVADRDPDGFPGWLATELQIVAAHSQLTPHWVFANGTDPTSARFVSDYAGFNVAATDGGQTTNVAHLFTIAIAPLAAGEMWIYVVVNRELMRLYNTANAVRGAADNVQHTVGGRTLIALYPTTLDADVSTTLQNMNLAPFWKASNDVVSMSMIDVPSRPSTSR